MKIIIYGKGDFARLMLYYFTKDAKYRVSAFCVDNAYKKNESQFCDLPLVSIFDVQKLYPPTEYKVFVAVGYSQMRNRVVMYDRIKLLGYQCVNYISPFANIDESVILGQNNAIFPQVLIEPFVTIKDNNIIWSSAIICHNVEMHSHCFLAAQTLVGGFSKISNNCFIGFNATISENICINNETLVGAKSLVKEDTNSYSKNIGIPSKIISTHKKEGIHLI